MWGSNHPLTRPLAAWPFAAAPLHHCRCSIINRERSAKAYRVLPYYVARFICDMPLRVGQGLLFGGHTLGCLQRLSFCFKASEASYVAALLLFY